MHNQDLWRNEGSSIINLFEKMTSNVTRFRESIVSSPSHSTHSNQSTQRLDPFEGACLCKKVTKQRKLEREFYSKQHELVSRAAALLEVEGQDTLSKLLTFMADYILKIEDEVAKELLCSCQKKQLEQHEECMHKIQFLRDENHKFFKMIEEKNDECEQLKKDVEGMLEQMKEGKQSRVSRVSRQSRENMENMGTSRVDSLCSRAETARAHLNEFVELSSRNISSNSSRVSEFRVAWPDSIVPMGEGTHCRYFEASPGDHQAHGYQKEEALADINLNFPHQSIFKRSKIFNSSLPKP